MLLVAYLLLGIGLLIGDGTLSGLLLAAASIVSLVSLKRSSSLSLALLPWMVALSGVLALVRAPVVGHRWVLLVPLTILQASLGVVVCLRPRFVGRWALAVALALYAVAGGLLITTTPAPRVDVYELEQEGARVLEAGGDPYVSTFANPYTKEETRIFFGDERAALREYPYPPLSLLATTLGHWIGRDVRWTLLAAQLGIAWLLFSLARGAGHDPRAGLAIATVHLLHPRGLFMLEQAWTDSLLACAFLLILLELQRARGVHRTGIAIGLFLAAKQYSVIALPLLLRDGRIRTRAWTEALALAVAVTLPFFLWSPSDFVGDVVLFQLRQPFREDALSLPALVAGVTGWHAPGVLALVGAGAATVVVWPRLRPGSVPSQLPMAAAFVFMSFFLLAKQAFCNYYYFAGVLILAAVALSEPAEAGRSWRRAGSSAKERVRLWLTKSRKATVLPQR